MQKILANLLEILIDKLYYLFNGRALLGCTPKLWHFSLTVFPPFAAVYNAQIQHFLFFFFQKIFISSAPTGLIGKFWFWVHYYKWTWLSFMSWMTHGSRSESNQSKWLLLITFDSLIQFLEYKVCKNRLGISINILCLSRAKMSLRTLSELKWLFSLYLLLHRSNFLDIFYHTLLTSFPFQTV